MRQRRVRAVVPSMIAGEMQQQIPFGNDSKKSKGKNKGKSEGNGKDNGDATDP